MVDEPSENGCTPSPCLNAPIPNRETIHAFCNGRGMWSTGLGGWKSLPPLQTRPAPWPVDGRSIFVCTAAERRRMVQRSHGLPRSTSTSMGRKSEMRIFLFFFFFFFLGGRRVFFLGWMRRISGRAPAAKLFMVGHLFFSAIPAGRSVCAFRACRLEQHLVRSGEERRALFCLRQTPSYCALP